MIISTEYLCSSSADLNLTLEHRSDCDDERWIVTLSTWDYSMQYFREGPARKMYASLAKEHNMREPWEWEHCQESREEYDLQLDASHLATFE